MVTGAPVRGAADAARAGLVASTAANLAGWHDLNVRALGLRSAWRDGWWLALDEPPPIYFRAVAVRPGADAAALRGLPEGRGGLVVCDPWSDLELGAGGLRVESERPWMVRAPGPLPEDALPDGLRIDRVADATALLAFERAAAEGFGAPQQPPHAWHAPPLLLDRRFDLWLGWLGERVVATANGFREAGVLGVYSVSTMPLARGRGYASALTAHAVRSAATIPAVLQPSDMAESLYRRLGFERFATFRTWTRSHR